MRFKKAISLERCLYYNNIKLYIELNVLYIYDKWNGVFDNFMLMVPRFVWWSIIKLYIIVGNNEMYVTVVNNVDRVYVYYTSLLACLGMPWLPDACGPQEMN